MDVGISFRKSFKIGKNTRINLSRGGGIGFSTGFKGFRISKNNYGLRVSLGGKGIYYTKWFTKKKKKRKEKKKIKDRDINKVEQEIEEENVIDPETDFERIPTEDEQALLLYLGSPIRNYILYFLFITLLGLGIYGFIEKTLLSYILIGVNVLLLGLYLFKSKLNYYIFGLNRSISLFEKNRFDKAYMILKKCLAIKPRSNKALILMMFTTFKLEKYQETVNYIDAYKKDYAPLEVMNFMEGVALCELGHYEEAISAIEKVYSEEEDIKYSKYKILGDCYTGLKEYDRAIRWYEELPVKEDEMNDDLLEYKYGLGKALLLSGKKKRAFSYLMEVYDYRADYEDVKELMSQI